MSEALRLAELLTNLIKFTVKGRENAVAMETAATELRRLHALVEEDSILQRRQRDEIAQLGQALARAIERINKLEAELAEQARLNGMGSSREARLMAENERRSDALQKLWKERDELRALNAELVEALREMLENGGDFTAKRDAARAALAKVGESK